MQATCSPGYEQSLRRRESVLFFKKWLKHPFQMGTLAPITRQLAKIAASCIKDPSGLIVEIGAGTGRLTRALLTQGVKPENLVLVELDSDFCSFLEDTLPGLPECRFSTPKVIHGDAAKLAEIIPTSFIGKTTTIVSAIPFMYISEEGREKIIKSCFDVIIPKGEVIHVTYNPKSPLAFLNTVHQERVENLWLNLPPGFVWKYHAAY
jgi:phosphatidylethanolamine/phosphatidyl-N-methylethanolamine N-methyltransferase